MTLVKRRRDATDKRGTVKEVWIFGCTEAKVPRLRIREWTGQGDTKKIKKENMIKITAKTL